jgi:hypothetical protein
MVPFETNLTIEQTRIYMATTRPLYKPKTRANACSAASSAVKVRVSGRAGHPAVAPARWPQPGVVDRFTDGAFVCSIHT